MHTVMLLNNHFHGNEYHLSFFPHKLFPCLISYTYIYIYVNKCMILRQVFNAGKVFTSPQGDM